MKTLACFLIYFSVALLTWSVSAQDLPSQHVLRSPDGKIGLTIQVDDELFYEAHYEGKNFLERSLLALKFQDKEVLRNLFVEDVQRDSADSTWEYPWGRQRKYRDHFNRMTIRVREKAGEKRSLGLECRVYDDGIAFRYLIDEKTVGDTEYILEQDRTQYNFKGEPDAWFADFKRFNSSQEHIYTKTPLSTIMPGAHVGCPLVVRSSETGPYFALTEAELNHWGGLYFESQPISGIKTLFDAGVIRGGEPGKTFSIDVEDVDKMVLTLEDAGDDISFDNANWCDMILTDRAGKKTYLSDLAPISKTQSFGELQIDQSITKKPLRINGVEYKKGLGTHANGHITFSLGGKFVKLEGIAGIDDATSGKGSVRFLIGTLPRIENIKLQASLSPRTDGKGLARTSAPGTSPWRLIIVSPTAAGLIDQTILMNVSAPTDPNTDWSWIKPGIGTFDWWPESNVNMSTAYAKRFVDFASKMGWEYHFLDDPWYAGKRYKMGDPRNNILTGSAETDIEELLAFAKEKNVRLILWLHWKDFDRQRDEAFKLYQKWGVAGLKIDFMDRDDQEMVEWYKGVVRQAAEHQIMIDFHGAFKPTGLRRAFPNLITREGIRGNENNKWSQISPEESCTVPFTRLMLGPGDFTPGAFLNRHYKGAKIEGKKTAHGTGTRAHELAISLLFDSPIICMCDDPDVYEGQPGLEFYRNLPTVWEVSKTLDGEIGQFVSSVRKSGDSWYYAAITDSNDRTLTLPLEFLGEGTYEATIYADTEETRGDARIISISTKNVSAKDTLTVKMIAGGGQAIVFKKLNPL